tara:strand:+ start:743 stop:2560 length:1818 start_codon:yes stop_codon:yes gene_type:complete
MTAVNFPTSPSNGATLTTGGVTYTYVSASTRWNVTGGTLPSQIPSGNSNPAVGAIGSLFYNTSTGALHISTGSAWGTVSGAGGASVSISESAPSSPGAGDLWFDPSDMTIYIYYNDGNSSQWVTFSNAGGGEAGASVTVQEAAPSSPSVGDLWFDPSDLTPYMYYNDGNSSQWVNFVSGMVASGSAITVQEEGTALATAADTFNFVGTGVTVSGTGATKTITVIPPTDWDTTLKTASFTAVSGKGYLINTAGGAITVTLPASPSAGDNVVISDAKGSADTNSITIARNGVKIYGNNANLILSNDRASISLIYTDATNGWVSQSGTDKLQSNIISLTALIIAGGGGGASNRANGNGTGGGGAGGMLAYSTIASQSTTYAIVVGAGGAQQSYTTSSRVGNNGAASSAFGTSTVGGGGGSGFDTGHTTAAGGGSGGGGGSAYAGGAGTAGQGNAGGLGYVHSTAWRGGGGGGKGAVGQTGQAGGDGGAGSNAYATWATATSTGANSGYYAGGGGAGSYHHSNAGSGGVGGGGNGANPASNGGAGTVNTGGGGGGGGSHGSAGGAGGAGGSGIVIIRYAGSDAATGGTVITTGGYTYHVFTSSGNFITA